MCFYEGTILHSFGGINFTFLWKLVIVIFLSFSNNFWTKKKFFSLYLLWMAYFVKLEKLCGIRLSFRFSALLHFHKTNSFPLSFLSFSLSLFLSHTHTQTHTNLVAISVLKKAKVKVSSILTSTLALVFLYSIALQFIFPSEKPLLQFLRKEW